MPSIRLNIHNMGAEKNIRPKAISLELSLPEYFFVKRSVRDKKKAQEIDNTIQMLSLPDV